MIGTRIFAIGAFLVAFLLVCLANAPATVGSTTKVWVNTKSGLYHCPGTRWYGKTKIGAFMKEREAQQNGYRPAGGDACDSASTSGGPQNEAIYSLGAQCGLERWPVKVLMDKDRELVNFSPVAKRSQH